MARKRALKADDTLHLYCSVLKIPTTRATRIKGLILRGRIRRKLDCLFLPLVAVAARAVAIDLEETEDQPVPVGQTQQCDVLLLLNAPALTFTFTAAWMCPSNTHK